MKLATTKTMCCPTRYSRQKCHILNRLKLKHTSCKTCQQYQRKHRASWQILCPLTTPHTPILFSKDMTSVHSYACFFFLFFFFFLPPTLRNSTEEQVWVEPPTPLCIFKTLATFTQPITTFFPD